MVELKVLWMELKGGGGRWAPECSDSSDLK